MTPEQQRDGFARIAGLEADMEAADVKAAVAWATRVSDAIGEAIEVRPVAGSRGR
jgi:hypothetical protein